MGCWVWAESSLREIFIILCVMVGDFVLLLEGTAMLFDCRLWLGVIKLDCDLPISTGVLGEDLTISA